MKYALSLAIAGAGLFLGRPAFADVLTLQCGAAGQLGSLTLDFDLDSGTVTIANGNPPKTVRAQVDDRFLNFNNPYVNHPTRIDRRTGGLYSYAESQWWPGGTCQKAAAGKLF